MFSGEQVLSSSLQAEQKQIHNLCAPCIKILLWRERNTHCYMNYEYSLFSKWKRFKTKIQYLKIQ